MGSGAWSLFLRGLGFTFQTVVGEPRSRRTGLEGWGGDSRIREGTVRLHRICLVSSIAQGGSWSLSLNIQSRKSAQGKWPAVISNDSDCRKTLEETLILGVANLFYGRADAELARGSDFALSDIS